MLDLINVLVADWEQMVVKCKVSASLACEGEEVLPEEMSLEEILEDREGLSCSNSIWELFSRLGTRNKNSLD